MDKTYSLNYEFFKTIGVEDEQDAITNSVVFKTSLGQTVAGVKHLEEGKGMDKIIKVGQGLIQIIGVITETIWEVIKGMGDKIIVEMDSGEILEIKAMREVGVSHMIGNSEVTTEETIEAPVTVDQDQVLEWVSIETELDALSVRSMIILQETDQQCK